MYGARLAGVEQATGIYGHVSRWMRRVLEFRAANHQKRSSVCLYRKNLENSAFQGFLRGGGGGQNGVRVHPGNHLCIPRRT